MYKKTGSIFTILLIASLSFAIAATSDCARGDCQQGQTVGGNQDEHGCIIDAGYSWNEEEQKCVREWETGEARYQEQTQAQNRIQAQEGTYVNNAGQEMKIQVRANNRLRVEAGGIGANCECELKQEKIQNKTRLYAQLSNGKNAEVKIMPDTASERALERLRLKVCSEENNCQIELKEAGKGEKVQLAYEMQIERHSRILGIFQKKMQVRAQIEAENGEVIKINKPWWAFLASEPTEE